MYDSHFQMSNVFHREVFARNFPPDRVTELRLEADEKREGNLSVR